MPYHCDRRKVMFPHPECELSEGELDVLRKDAWLRIWYGDCAGGRKLPMRPPHDEQLGGFSFAWARRRGER